LKINKVEAAYPKKEKIRAFVAKQNGRFLKIPKETKKLRMHE
jgi:hypothetical protein